MSEMLLPADVFARLEVQCGEDERLSRGSHGYKCLHINRSATKLG